MSAPLLSPEERRQIARQIAASLLETGAVHLRPQQPFTWTSGWRSPIYCDNRLTLSFPAVRQAIKEALARTAQHHFAPLQGVAGVATAGIPQGALVAEQLGLPFLYVRSSPKGHGMENLIEGHADAGSRLLVVEDLISTGGSSLKACQALQAAGYPIAGLVAVFSYGFDQARHAFAEAGIPLATLSDYDTLVEVALEKGLIGTEEVATLSAWRQSPSTWGQ